MSDLLIDGRPMVYSPGLAREVGIAEAVVLQALAETTFDCVVIGAGIRAVPDYLLLFEKVINAVHQGAPSAKLCFNTRPGDTAEAVQRWI